jgi:hypothetical protein
MQRALESRAFISAILAMALGTFLFYTHPFPDEQIFLRVIALRAPQAFLSFKYLYYLLLFTTPFLVCSTALSGLYIFTLKARQHISPGRLPKYPDPSKRDDLFLVVGEVHNPRKPVPAKAPYWLTIPERGLFTGVAILGAIGSGKSSCAMYPFAEQILAYKAGDKEKRIGGLTLEVKGDFCRKVKEILTRHGRAEDYIEIGLDSEHCYNPLHSDLDAYALAFNIASLLNNLFGRGKEPFWQQAYTNLVKFSIRPPTTTSPSSMSTSARSLLRSSKNALPRPRTSFSDNTTWPSRRRSMASAPPTSLDSGLCTMRPMIAFLLRPFQSCGIY